MDNEKKVLEFAPKWKKYLPPMQHGIPAPWGKLHASLLDDEDWLDWSFTEKGVWLSLLMLRYRTGKNLPGDFKKITRMLSTESVERQWATKVIKARIKDESLLYSSANLQLKSKNTPPIENSPGLDEGQPEVSPGLDDKQGQQNQQKGSKNSGLDREKEKSRKEKSAAPEEHLDSSHSDSKTKTKVKPLSPWEAWDEDLEADDGSNIPAAEIQKVIKFCLSDQCSDPWYRNQNWTPKHLRNHILNNWDKMKSLIPFDYDPEKPKPVKKKLVKITGDPNCKICFGEGEYVKYYGVNRRVLVPCEKCHPEKYKAATAA